MAQRLHQHGFAAEQVRTAGDVQYKTIRMIERHQWRKTVAPVSDRIQRL